MATKKTFIHYNTLIKKGGLSNRSFLDVFNIDHKVTVTDIPVLFRYDLTHEQVIDKIVAIFETETGYHTDKIRERLVKHSILIPVSLVI
jgi:hypothetical protein